MAYGELYIEPERKTTNAVTGRFLKGHVPHNKGKKWSEWMDMRKTKRVKRIAKKNLRPNMNIGGWNKRKVIAIDDKTGKWYVFESSQDAARKTGASAGLIRRCCRKANVHHHHGLRWFWENDNEWTKFIKR